MTTIPSSGGIQPLTHVTDASGNYTFINVPLGDYRVGETQPAGYASVSDKDGGNLDQIGDNTLITVTNGATNSGNTFIEERLRSIGDYVWLDENSNGLQDAGEAGIGNVRVELYAANGVTLLSTTYTDASGGYLFANLAPETYVVKEATAGTGALAAGLAANPTYDLDGIGTAHEASVLLLSGQELATADFGYDWASTPDVTGNTGTGSIGDRVWVDADGDGVQDPGEPGLGGVTVTLTNAGPDGLFGNGDDLAPVVTVTAADGSYVFDTLAAGVYAVTVTAPGGYAQTGDPDATLDHRTTAPIVLGPGDVFVNADFGYQPNVGTSGDITGVAGCGRGPAGSGWSAGRRRRPRPTR